MTDWPALLPDVARRLLGDPPRTEAAGATWRYRSRGSLAVHVGGDRVGALRWLVDACAETGADRRRGRHDPGRRGAG